MSLNMFWIVFEDNKMQVLGFYLWAYESKFFKYPLIYHLFISTNINVELADIMEKENSGISWKF